jgi:hypothetical protein
MKTNRFTDEQTARVQALGMYCIMGPDYDRSVNTHVRDAILFADRGVVDAAEHHILLAEVCAGKLTWEEYEALDPFRP